MFLLRLVWAVARAVFVKRADPPALRRAGFVGGARTPVGGFARPLDPTPSGLIFIRKEAALSRPPQGDKSP